MSPERYPAMHRIFHVYFGQDFDLFGETIAEIVACYKKDSPHTYSNLIHEINSFMDEHSADLDCAFERSYGAGFDPTLWGHTTESFLNELKRLMSE
ncbi:contact-dependent growth inhibition system immunity protein [Paraburkholderia sp. BR14374]